MDKYLISILKEVNTIIIPGIGALTIVNQETGEVMFMSYMKFDDEKLAKHIAEKEGWELNDAKNLVSKYVRDINTKLDQGDSYDIYQFGSFFKGTDGEIEFSSWDGLSNSSSDTVVVEGNSTENSVSELEEKEEQPDPIQEKLEDIQVEAEATIVDLKEEVEEIKTEEEDHSIDAVIDLVEEVVVPVEDKAEVEQEIIEEKTDPPSKPLSEEEQWKDDLDIPPINTKKEIKKKPILEKTQKDKKKKKRGVGFYLLLTLLVLLVGGGTFFAIHYDDLKEHIPFLASKTQEEANEPIEDEVEITEPDNITEEETIPEEQTNNEEVIPEEVEVIEEATPKPIIVNNANGLSINQSLPIQVIVGSFTEESNAERKVAQLKAAGVNAEIIGRYDGLHLVSIASFNSMSDVKSSTETIKSAAGTYWIFKK